MAAVNEYRHVPSHEKCILLVVEADLDDIARDVDDTEFGPFEDLLDDALLGAVASDLSVEDDGRMNDGNVEDARGGDWEAGRLVKLTKLLEEELDTELCESTTDDNLNIITELDLDAASEKSCEAGELLELEGDAVNVSQ